MDGTVEVDGDELGLLLTFDVVSTSDGLYDGTVDGMNADEEDVGSDVGILVNRFVDGGMEGISE